MANSKETNYGGKSFVVDSLTELYPRSTSKISALKSTITGINADNSSQLSTFKNNFSLSIDGSLEMSAEYEDDGKTIKNYTDVEAVVLYFRAGHNMIVTDIPSSAYSWYKYGSDDVLQEGGKTLRVTEVGKYQCFVTYTYKLSNVESMYSGDIGIQLGISFEVQYGTLSLYTYSDASTKSELLGSLDNLRWYPDLDAIDRTATYLWRKDSTDGGATWTYFRMTGDKGEKGESAKDSIVIQYQYSDSDIYAPVKFKTFVFGGKTVKFKTGLVGDNDDDDWSKNPVHNGKYKWMRVSYDNGKTWDYSVISGPEPSFFEVLSSKDTFRQNSRGAVVSEDTITFWTVRHNMNASDEFTWTVKATFTEDGETVEKVNAETGLIASDTDLTSDEITITVPYGFKPQSFTVYAKAGVYGDTLSKTITGEATGEIVATKLPTIDLGGSYIIQENMPTTLPDGISPLSDGDYCLVKLRLSSQDAADDEQGDIGKTYLVPARYTVDSTGVGSWVFSTEDYENHSEIMASVLQEVLANSQTVPSVSAMYAFIQSLVASNAFIKFLESTYIKVNAAIYGGAFSLDDKNNLSAPSGSTGFAIESNGQITANNIIVDGARIDNAEITDATVKGQLHADALWTSSAADNTDLSWMNAYTFQKDLWSQSKAYDKLSTANPSYKYQFQSIPVKYKSVEMDRFALVSAQPQPVDMIDVSGDGLQAGTQYSGTQKIYSSDGPVVALVGAIENKTDYPIWAVCSSTKGGSIDKVYVEHWSSASNPKKCWWYDSYNMWILPGECIGVYLDKKWTLIASTAYGYGQIRTYFNKGIPTLGYAKLGNISATAGGTEETSGEIISTTSSSYATIPYGVNAFDYVIRDFTGTGYNYGVGIIINNQKTKLATKSNSRLSGTIDCSPGDVIRFYVWATGYQSGSSDDREYYEGTATAYGCSLVYLPTSKKSTAMVGIKDTDTDQIQMILTIDTDPTMASDWKPSTTNLQISSYNSDENLEKVSGTTVCDKLFRGNSNYELNYTGHTNEIVVNGQKQGPFARMKKRTDSAEFEGTNGEEYNIYMLGANDNKGFYDSVVLNLYPADEQDQEQVRTKKLVPKTNSSTSEDPKTGISYDIGEEDNRYNTVYANELFSGSLKLDNLPTSSDGLATGQVWNDNGTLKIKT